MRTSRLRVLYFVVHAWIILVSCGVITAAQNDTVPSRFLPSRSETRESHFLYGRSSLTEPGAAPRYHAVQQKLQMRQKSWQKISREFAIPQNVWTPLGPAPLASDASGVGQQDYNWVSGRATAVAVDTADPSGNTVYLGGAYGGVWKSANAGSLSQDPANVVWSPLADDQATLAVGAIAIQPQLTNPDPKKSVVLVGTGEANSSLDSYYGLGILRSANAGQSWALISSDSSGTHSFAGLGFSKIAFSTVSPAHVVAATASTWEGIRDGLENPVQANLGIYGSIDGGKTWNYGSITDAGVTISPGSVTSVAYHTVAGKFFAAVRYHGFYSSSDGLNWTRLSNQPGTGLTAAACPTQLQSPSNCPIYRGEIAVTPGRNELYVWFVDANDQDQGIWLSNDGGNSWTQLNETGITNCGDQFGCGTEQGSYNLALLATPNGSATDLYAGAVNLYKCTISSIAPTCNGTGSGTFQNLTHAYGCPPDFGSIAHVHPAQHAIASLIDGGGRDIMYFANDGGLYRALDGYSDLTSGTCGIPNSFDGLNQTLGSMTQIVGFAQSNSDPNVLLAGSDGNGAPATATALLSQTWQNVNYGDSGYTQVSTSNENQWYLSVPPNSLSGVNIFACSSGITCHFQDFQNNQVVSGSMLGGDTGAYYTPYIFDPAKGTVMLVGTCRLWRGTPGGNFAVLSHSFETGGDDTCTGDDVNLVRTVAVGGALDTNGNSNVMYVGTDGLGPLQPTTPPGGHVWVSTNVAGGSNTWSDRTGSINPNAFPISGIAMDSSDPAGLTAYVAIMGFHTIHVWQTTNGGISWTDFTGNLPDAPVNTILVDPGSVPSNGTIYVGTDAGVFASSTAAASWTEVGPAATSGQSGYLPNVAVTSLQMFNSSTNKILRASTYGRGIWQYPLITTPDFVVSISPNQQTVFGNQNGDYIGGAISLNSYGSQVNLTCTAGGTQPPQNCSASPGSVVPSPSGTAFTLTGSGVDGDYLFNLHAVGTDQSQTTHDYALQLHIVDFALTSPSPSNVTVNEPGTSVPIGFQVTAAGSFSGEVDLSCSGLPANASCEFSPSNVVNPTSHNPVSVTLHISVASGTATGTYPVMLVGTTSGGPQETQSVSLAITDVADYGLTIADPKSQSAPVNSAINFDGTLTAVNGYGSSVILSCVAGSTAPPPTCTANPATLTPTASGVTFSIAVKSNVVGTYRFNVLGTGTDPSHIQHSVPVVFISTFQFNVTNQSGVQSIAAGQTATYDLDLAPIGSNFPQIVTLKCSGLPTESTCAFSPTQVSAGSGETPVAFSITTTAPVLAQRGPKGVRGIWYATGLFFAIVLTAPSKRRRFMASFLLILVLCVAGIESACSGISSGGKSGGGGQPGTPPGTYTVTVTATMGSTVNTTPIQLTVN